MSSLQGSAHGKTPARSGGSGLQESQSRETRQKAGKARERERNNQEISSEEQSQKGENQGE